MKEYFQKLALYNRWANSRLYEVCAKLTSSKYLKERKAFFSSIHGTLLHYCSPPPLDIFCKNKL